MNIKKVGEEIKYIKENVMNEEEKVEDMIRTLADEVPLRDLLDEMITEMRELRAQLNRIEAQLNENKVTKIWGEHYTGTTI